MSDLPNRKRLRLAGYDYSQAGAYFVTICAKDRHNLFGRIDAGAIINRPQVTLAAYGDIVAEAINNIPSHYPGISVDKYVIMPNHTHMILVIHESGEDGRLIIAPTVSTVVQQLKRHVTKQIGISPWQKSFHDHIIRNEAEYLKIWQYIDENPAKWAEDCYYMA